MTASKIEWTEQVWNPLAGCTVHSPGCTNCYAMKMAARIERMSPQREHYRGTTRVVNGKPVWTGKIGFSEEALLKPLRRKVPTRYFVNSMSDLFHAWVSDETIDRVFAVMALCPQHTFQVLTKRSDRMRAYLTGIDNDGERLHGEGWRSALVEGMAQTIWHKRTGDDTVDEWLAVHLPLPNVWLGVSVEDQARADERIPDLLATPAAVRWISAEPLLGPVDLEPWLAWPDCAAEMPDGRGFGCQGCDMETAACTECPRDKAYYEVTEGPRDALGCPEWVDAERITIDWVVCGGESGKDARPMHPDWARALRDQCGAAGMPFFFKQWGEWVDALTAPIGFCGASTIVAGDFMARVGKKKAGRLLDSVEHSAYPTVLSPSKGGVFHDALPRVSP